MSVSREQLAEMFGMDMPPETADQAAERKEHVAQQMRAWAVERIVDVLSEQLLPGDPDLLGGDIARNAQILVQYVSTGTVPDDDGDDE